MKWFYFSAIVLLLALNAQISHSQDEGGESEGPPPLTGLFNCNRGLQECMNNATCGDDGLCVCEEGFQGYDCSVNASAEVTCDPECANDGLCYDDEGTPKCLCTEMYHGDGCEDMRITHECFPDSMEISISPIVNSGDEGFTGLMYVTDQAAEEGCSLAEGDVPGTFTGTLDFESCGNATNITTETLDIERSFTITLQYNSVYLTDTDQEFLFKCILKAPDSELDLGESEVESDPDKKPFDTQEVSAELLPIEISITDAEGQPLDTAQEIGALLKLNYKLNAGDVYDSFRVMEILATNGLEGEEEETIQFVENGCVTENAAPLVQDFSGDPTSETSLVFKLFKFLKTYKLEFQNTVKVCKETGNCNATECDTSSFPGLGRRRRDIILTSDNDDEVYSQYNKTLYLAPVSNNLQRSSAVQPVTQYQAGALYEPTIGECMQSMAFLIITLVLIVVVLISVAICSACCVRLIHARPHHHNKA